jgi:hypothetical protein
MRIAPPLRFTEFLRKSVQLDDVDEAAIVRISKMRLRFKRVLPYFFRYSKWCNWVANSKDLVQRNGIVLSEYVSGP